MLRLINFGAFLKLEAHNKRFLLHLEIIQLFRRQYVRKILITYLPVEKNTS